MEILCFYAGMMLYYSKSIYPLCFLIILLLFKSQLRLVRWFLSAMLLSFFHDAWIADQGMPQAALLPRAQLQGYISSIPAQSIHKTQFQFTITHLDQRQVHATALLNCYLKCPILEVGEHWQLIAKLKRPLNLRNPGGFDYQRFLSAKHLFWTGNIRNGSFQRLDETRRYPLLRLRAQLAERLVHLFPDEQILGITQALTIGVTTHIEPAEWDLFRHTGTIHLMVISGAHIGLVAGIIYSIVGWIWRRSGHLCLYMPAQKIASMASIAMALVYAILSGFAVPAERALIVCVVMLWRYIGHQRYTVWQAWRYSLFLVLIFEPHSVLMPGFYLSFCAVASLLLVNQRFAIAGIRKTLLIQMGCLLGLMPLTLYWYGYGAINGLAANLLAIPWVGFVIIPMALLSLVLGSSGLGIALKQLLVPAIQLLLYYLNRIDAFSFLNLQASLPDLLTAIALIFGLFCCLFIPRWDIYLSSLLIFVASLFPYHERVKPETAMIDVLDVGQGLAILVRTANHQLLYDTGMKFYQGSDMGKMAILPYFKTIGVNTLDTLVISHPDLDHRGGFQSIQAQIPIQTFIVDDPKFYHQGVSCHEYPAWNWDGIAFQFFPIAAIHRRHNNRSCVLKISTDTEQILLTGDIEKEAERMLVEEYGHLLNSSILVLAHHGSKTSSTMPFLKLVNPKLALVSYGFDNRYHFPHQQTLYRLQDRHIPLLNTVDCGLIRAELSMTLPSKIYCAGKLQN